MMPEPIAASPAAVSGLPAAPIAVRPGTMVHMVALTRLTDALLEELATSFPDRRVLGIWLYGSHARHEARGDSDIDVGVLCDEALAPVALFDATGRLEARLGTAVDLVDLRQAGGLLRVEATHHGCPLVTPTTEADLFTTHVLADHAAFARNRRAATSAFEEKFRV
jgi:predicted nucleotidyltransferase